MVAGGAICGGSGVVCGVVDCGAGCGGGTFGVAPCGFAPDGAGAGSPDPGGIGGTAGCFWPGNSDIWPLFKFLSC
jgi:hypothetical protein